MSSSNPPTACGRRRHLDALLGNTALRGGLGTLILALTGVALSGGSVAALDPNALPKGGQVTAGTATLTQTAPGKLNVTQQSDRAVIDYKSFDIGAKAAVTFQQPSSSAIAVNRVNAGTDPSKILGTLTANGQVMILNPNGVIFGRDAKVDVAGMVASTGNINDAAFMRGDTRLDLAGPASGAKVVNHGTITARDGGLVALVAPSVANDGVINARLGRVALAGASKVTLDLYGDQLIQIAVDGGSQAGGTLVSNAGRINADGGRVQLTAETARAVVDQVINMSGVVQARGISVDGGTIVLDGGSKGTVSVAGTLDTTAAASGGVGGTIKVLGERVAIAGSATLDASGDGGGGTVLVGGNRQGQGAERTATATTIAAGAKVAANARTKGNGGTVVAWANDQGSYGGTLSAKGGAAGGAGGVIETSAKTVALAPTLSVDASAPKGAAGTWLLDPADITIDSSLAATLANTLAGGTSTQVTTSAGTGGNGDLTLAASINASATNGAGLTLTGRHLARTGSSTVNITGAGSGLTLNVNAVNTSADVRAQPTNWIQDAVNMIGSVTGGTTINLAAGQYAGGVNLDKTNLTLRGAQSGVDARTRSGTAETVVTGAGTANGAFAVMANNVTIDGFTIQGAGSQSAPAAGIWTNPSFSGTQGGTRIVNNIIQNNQIGVYLQNDGSLQTVVQHNLFKDNTVAGPAGGTAIYSDAGLKNALIDANRFVNNPNAAITLISSNATGTSNVISNNTMDSQIYLYGQTSGRVTGNVVTNSSGGGLVFGGLNSGLTIANNEVNGVAAGFAALRVRNDGGANTNLTFTNNIFDGGAAFGVRTGAGGYTGTLTLSGGQISGGTAAVQNDDANLAIDASGTWWGTTNPTAVANQITGAGASKVDFSPMLMAGDSNASAVGFQANFSNLMVTTLGAQTGSTNRIQEGVNLVDAGGIVNIAAGTYAITSTVSITKGLSLLGPNMGIAEFSSGRAAEAVIVPNVAAGPAFRIDTGAPVIIDGLKFDGGIGSPIDNQAGGGRGDITLRNNLFSNLVANPFFSNPTRLTLDSNRFTAMSDQTFSDGLQVAGNWNGTTGTVVDIRNNQFDNQRVSGMNLSNVSGTITGNTFQNLSYYGILLANNSGNLSITNNVFDGIVNPNPAITTTWGAGIRFFAPSFTGSVVISGNEFKNSVIGVAVRAGGNITGQDIQVTGNSFHDNVQGVRNEGTGTLNASANWWGTTDATAISSQMTGSVDFSPYLASGVDTAASTPGFQGNFGSLFVTALGAQSGSTGRIQEGVNLVTAGGMVRVGAGTFGETVSIGKTLTLAGAGSGLTTLRAATPGSGIGILVNNAANVVVSGISLANYATGVQVNGSASGLALRDVSLTGNGIDIHAGRTDIDATGATFVGARTDADIGARVVDVAKDATLGRVIFTSLAPATPVTPVTPTIPVTPATPEAPATLPQPPALPSGASIVNVLPPRPPANPPPQPVSLRDALGGVPASLGLGTPGAAGSSQVVITNNTGGVGDVLASGGSVVLDLSAGGDPFSQTVSGGSTRGSNPPQEPGN